MQYYIISYFLKKFTFINTEVEIARKMSISIAVVLQYILDKSLEKREISKRVESSLLLWYNTMHCFVCFKFYYTGLTFFANKFTLLYMLFTRIGKKIRQPL